jgi:pre-rRNA-processing protein TSR1
MKEGSWDPNEGLPKEYANIYHFQNFKQTIKKIIKSTHDEGLKISGTYITIKVKEFKQEDIPFILSDTPLIVSTLLEHEKKVCVLHFRVTPHYEYSEQVQSKNLYEIHAGFRRFLSKPVFSFDQNNDKLKYEKKLIQDKFYYASIYGQLIYPNTSVLLFRPNLNQNNQLELVAKGTVVEENANRVILKKIILTGYPLKITKKKAVVRYMFFNPEDVNYFKPIELSTKNGLRGHIKESLGTHGHMKCFFNDFIKSHDTVCMTLYKRVFPKLFRETWKYKIYFGNRSDYLKYFIDEINLKREKESLIKKNIDSIVKESIIEEEKKSMMLD